MQYLMMDVRNRFLGTLERTHPLAVGEVLEADNAKTYTVVRIDERRSGKPAPSITVVAGRLARTAE